MKKINTYLFITLVAIVVLFIAFILVRDQMNRLQYERFEAQTIAKTEQLIAENQQLTERVGHMKQAVDSLKTRLYDTHDLYLSDSSGWAEQQEALLRRHRQTVQELRETRRKLDESIRNQRIVVPRLAPRAEPGN